MSVFADAPHRHSFPTRRSSDLLERVADVAEIAFGGEARLVRVHVLRLAIGAHHALPVAENNVLSRDAEPHVVLCRRDRSEEHTSELQSPYDLVCRLLLEKKKIY